MGDAPPPEAPPADAGAPPPEAAAAPPEGAAAPPPEAAAAPPPEAAPPAAGAPPSLTIDPPAANMPAGGGVSTHTLANPSAVRLAFKVKSSNNTDYRLKPVYGFVEPMAVAPVEITRTAGPPRSDKLVIQFKEAAADAPDATVIFKEGAPLGEVVLPLNAA
uniref:Major sperm protein n=1 Tax=Parascaris univalens TaxID=6257 RepID=A0A915CGS8_PARUN